MRSGIFILIAVIATTWLTAFALRTPTPRPASIATTAFSAERARSDLDWIAAESHPIGSPALARVRERLVEQLRAIGAEVESRGAFAHDLRERDGAADVVAANLANVVATLPGRDRSLSAIVLMSHIDSVPHSPGAADDGIGVIAMLETARALKAGPQPLRDVVLVFTDGEEVGLLGARALFARDPVAARIGALINLEARGSSGPVSMFETGADNAAMVALYGRTVTQPNASSLTRFAYERMPNSTDFSVALAHGVVGFNLAILDNQFDYHAATATAANLDAGSVQQMGDQTLALTRELANLAVLPGASANAVYSDLFGRWLIHYPAWFGWLLLAVGTLVLVLALRRVRVSAANFAADIGVALYATITTALLLRLGYRLLGGTATARLSEGRELLAGFDLFILGAGAVALGVVLLACIGALRGRGRTKRAALALLTGVACCIDGLDIAALAGGVVAAGIALPTFARRRGLPGVGFGAAVLLLVVGIVTQGLAPELTPLLHWPLLLAGAALVLSCRRGTTPLVAVLTVLGTAFAARFGQQTLVALGFGMPESGAVPVLLVVPLWFALLASMMHPLAIGERRSRIAVNAAAPGLVAGLFVIAGALLWARVALLPEDNARRPALSQVFHVSDIDTMTDYRASPLEPLDDWSRRALSIEGASISRGELPVLSSLPLWRADAAAVTARPTRLMLATDDDASRQRLTVQAPDGVRELRLQLRGNVALDDVRLDGEPVAMLGSADRWNRLRLFPAGQPVVLTWRNAGSGGIEIRHAAIDDRWPADAPVLPPRGDAVMPWSLSDAHVTVGTTRLGWSDARDAQPAVGEALDQPARDEG